MVLHTVMSGFDSYNLYQMNQKHRGAVSEQFVLAQLMELGLTVSVPVGDNAQYDVVIDLDGKMIRGQIKTGIRRNGALCYATRKTGSNTKRTISTDYRGKADIFLIFDPTTKVVYVERVDTAPIGGQSTLRIDVPSKKMRNIKYATNYVLSIEALAALAIW